MAWYVSLYTTFMTHNLSQSTYRTMLSVNVGVCEGESVLWQSLQCTLSLSHTYTHSLYCKMNISSYTFAFIWQKSCWVHYCSCWHRWKRCQHTHHSLSSSYPYFIFLLGRGVINSCGWRLNLEEVIMTTESVCFQISVRWSCVSWLTCQLTHSCWESFRTLKQTPSPCWQPSGGYTLPYIVYIMHIQNTYFYCVFLNHACFQFETSLGPAIFFNFFLFVHLGCVTLI